MDDFEQIYARQMAVFDAEQQRLAAEARQRQKDERRRARRQAQMDALLGQLAPAAHRWATAGNPLFRGKVLLHNVVDWVMNPPTTTFVVLGGPSGAGKTSLAWAAVHEATRREWQDVVDQNLERDPFTGFEITDPFKPIARVVSAQRLAVARVQSRAGTGEAEEVRLALESPWLIIDDLGQESQTPSSAVSDVVFARYDAQKRTWITTGLTFDKIDYAYGRGFGRRLVDRSTVVKLGKLDSEPLPGVR